MARSYTAGEGRSQGGKNDTGRGYAVEKSGDPFADKIVDSIIKQAKDGQFGKDGFDKIINLGGKLIKMVQEAVKDAKELKTSAEREEALQTGLEMGMADILKKGTVPYVEVSEKLMKELDKDSPSAKKPFWQNKSGGFYAPEKPADSETFERVLEANDSFEEASLAGKNIPVHKELGLFYGSPADKKSDISNSVDMKNTGNVLVKGKHYFRVATKDASYDIPVGFKLNKKAGIYETQYSQKEIEKASQYLGANDKETLEDIVRQNSNLWANDFEKKGESGRGYTAG